MNMLLNFFQQFLSHDLLSQRSLEQTTVCNGCLKNIVLNEKKDSEHEDNLELVEWPEDKVESLFVLPFLVSIFDEKVLVVRLFFPVDSSEIHT